MQVVEVKVRPQLFSIRRPLSYQVADAFILPQPSSLVGALASCLAKLGFRAIKVGDEYVKALINYVLKGLVRVAIKPVSPVMASPVVLSRLRVLEKNLEELEIEGRVSDAMIREYVYGSFILYFVFHNNELSSKAQKALFLLERIGDTESLVAIESVNLCSLKELKETADIDTSTRADWVESISGNFVAVRMYTEDFACEVKRVGREKEKLKNTKTYLNELRKKYERMFYLPLKAEVLRNRLYFIPTSFRAQPKPGFKVIEAEAEDKARLVVSSAYGLQ